MSRTDAFWRSVFLAVPVLVFGLFVLWPLSTTFYYSFTNWNGFNSDYDFVGFSNFAKIITDHLFLNAIINTSLWMLSAIFVPTTIGLLLALAIDTKVPGGKFFKSVFYLPICLSAVVVGQTWIWMYQPDWGLINTLVGTATGTQQHFAWLANPDTALWSVIAAWVWQQTGLAMVIYLAGLTSIPEDLIEACTLEGGNAVQRTWHVVFPLLAPATIVVVALSVINSLKGFDILYVMTGGGPFNSSDTLAMHMYNESFRKYMMGYGSAIAVVLFLIAIAIIGFYFRQLKKVDEIYG